MSRVVISCFVSIQFRFWEAKKKSNKSGGLFPSSAGATRPRPRRHVSVGRSFHDFAQIHRSMAGSSVDWVFIGFYRVLPCFYCFFFVRAWKSLIVLNATAKKTDWNEWFCWFPIARLLKRINELALFTGAAIKSGPTGFYRVLPGFYWVFPGFFVRAWKSLMVLNVAAKKNRLEWMVLLAFVC